MWLLPLYIIIIGLIVYLTVATLYLLVLVVAYFVVKEPETAKSTKLTRFAILVPAHNEELLISRLCDSLLNINYPKEFHQIFIIADNCNDKTAEICKAYTVNLLNRNDPSRIGKGYALSWALGRVPLQKFDAVFMVDADNVVDTFILDELNQSINRGEHAIQCNNSVANRNDSWFTQLLFVSRTIGNLLYHHSKYKLGLSSYLMGNGICFSTKLLLKKGWTAFTVGEDWEYYAQLIEDRIKIGFAVKAKVYHQESRSLGQATSQRLRWSSGRFNVLRKLGFKLFLKGLVKRNWFTLDASLPLIFPNYSLHFNLTILTLILCLLLPTSTFKTYAIALGMGLIWSQIMVFATGAYLAGAYWRIFKAILHAPVFLAWKLIIDFLSVTGIYRGRKWVRTKRHISLQRLNIK
jgi:cellulose synthase/poly-beta-1,6-N-acetylglucosamine synthase-like glycosyltransferase